MVLQPAAVQLGSCHLANDHDHGHGGANESAYGVDRLRSYWLVGAQTALSMHYGCVVQHFQIRRGHGRQGCCFG